MTIFLVNGVMLQGAVAGFDQFSLVLERGGQVQLVYKHAISTLQPGIRSTWGVNPARRTRLSGFQTYRRQRIARGEHALVVVPERVGEGGTEVP
jgi:RNA chaperone Hfq